MRFRTKAGLALVFILLILLGFHCAGPALVVNRPQRCDVLIVLAGDVGDVRYWKGVELLRAGYARHMLLDARDDMVVYGRTPMEAAQEFVRRTAPGLPVSVCATHGDSTLYELRTAAPCLRQVAPQSVLLVTSDFHTRRALSIARKTLPQYAWSVAAVDSGLMSSRRWWGDREVAKNVFMEWQKLVWWEVVERRH